MFTYDDDNSQCCIFNVQIPLIDNGAADNNGSYFIIR